jgi:hypothetical protein
MASLGVLIAWPLLAECGAEPDLGACFNEYPE